MKKLTLALLAFALYTSAAHALNAPISGKTFIVKYPENILHLNLFNTKDIFTKNDNQPEPPIPTEPARMGTLKYQIQKNTYHMGPDGGTRGEIIPTSCVGEVEVPIYDIRGLDEAFFSVEPFKCVTDLYGKSTDTYFYGMIVIHRFSGVDETSFFGGFSYVDTKENKHQYGGNSFSTKTMPIRDGKFYISPVSSLPVGENTDVIETLSADIELIDDQQ